MKWEYLWEYEFDLPDMAEQRKLARVLWAVNDTIEAYKRLMSATEELVRGQFVEMFGLPSRNEHEFSVATIGDVVRDVHYGTSAKASEQGKYEGSQFDSGCMQD